MKHKDLIGRYRIEEVAGRHNSTSRKSRVIPVSIHESRELLVQLLTSDFLGPACTNVFIRNLHEAALRDTKS